MAPWFGKNGSMAWKSLQLLRMGTLRATKCSLEENKNLKRMEQYDKTMYNPLKSAKSEIKLYESYYQMKMKVDGPWKTRIGLAYRWYDHKVHDTSNRINSYPWINIVSFALTIDAIHSKFTEKSLRKEVKQLKEEMRHMKEEMMERREKEKQFKRGFERNDKRLTILEQCRPNAAAVPPAPTIKANQPNATTAPPASTSLATPPAPASVAAPPAPVSDAAPAPASDAAPPAPASES